MKLKLLKGVIGDIYTKAMDKEAAKALGGASFANGLQRQTAFENNVRTARLIVVVDETPVSATGQTESHQSPDRRLFEVPHGDQD